MTSEELIAAVRVRLDDTALPYRVESSLILEQASLTQTEFARSTLALYGVSSGSVTASDPWLSIPENMVVVKTVVLGGSQLRPITTGELDFGYFTINNVENSTRYGDWRTLTGTPKFVITDMYPDKVRLVPYPNTNGTASIEGFVTPPDLVFDGIATPVDPQIPLMYHELLMAGTLLRLYLLMDVDVADAAKAQFYGKQWYEGLVEARNNLQTALRRQMRLMELPRGFIYDAATPPTPPTQPA